VDRRVLGLWNVVEIHQVKKMVKGTKKGLLINVHHVDALREYAEATQDNLSKLAKRISDQKTFLWNRMEEISSKAAVNDALRPIRAISKIATTITAHRLDRAVLDLVNVQKVVSDYAERLKEDGWYIELNGWQGLFQIR
jgi:tRNA A58 N-methylase Trm61